MKSFSPLFFALAALACHNLNAAPQSEHQKACSQLSAGNELYFSFTVEDLAELDDLATKLSLDKIEGNRVYAYANREEFESFLSWGSDFRVEKEPYASLNITCSDYKDVRGIPEFKKWPSYEGYLNLMQSYQTNFPKLCRVFEIGKTAKGRSTLCLVLTGENKGPKPKVAQLGALHGNEVVGTMVSFRMINQLISGYQANDSVATAILNNTEIWYVPFCNLDGTYKGGNSNIKGAQRGNSNGTDLNRRFPSLPGKPLSGKEEVEVKTIMDLMTKNRFTLAADFHGGTSAYLTPYTLGASPAHPDQKFHSECGKRLADKTVGGIKVGSAKSLVNYWASNTLVDYFNLHGHAKGYTLELGPKMIEDSTFDKHWNKFKDMYITFYQYAVTGINGVVTDARTGQPIPNAKVFVENHDQHNSWVYSHDDGAYFRPIGSGTYSVTFSHQNYANKTVNNISVKDFEKTVISASLEPNYTIQ